MTRADHPPPLNVQQFERGSHFTDPLFGFDCVGPSPESGDYGLHLFMHEPLGLCNVLIDLFYGVPCRAHTGIRIIPAGPLCFLI